MMLSVDVENEYRRHVGALSHYAAVLVGPDDAMDVVNDAVAATWADWDTERIAAALGVFTGTVRKQLGRARQRLREVLNNE